MIFFSVLFLTAKIRGAVSPKPFRPEAFPYVYSSRSKAAKACRKAGFRGLCAKSQIEGYVQLLDRPDRDWSELVNWPFFSSIMDKLDNKHAFPEEMILRCLAFACREFMGGQEKETGVLGEPRVRWSECRNWEAAHCSHDISPFSETSHPIPMDVSIHSHTVHTVDGGPQL